MTARAPGDAHTRMLALVPPGGSAADERRRFVNEVFRRGGFPTRKDEDWRFSGFGELARFPFRRLAPRETDTAGIEPWPTGTKGEAVLVNGRGSGSPGAPVELFEAATAPADLFDRDPDGTLRPALPVFLADARDRLHRPGLDLAACFRNPLEMLNAGLFGGGACLRVAAGTECGPVLLRSVRREDAGADAPGMLHPRFLITLGARSRATVIEVHEGEHSHPEGWTNPSTVVRLGAGARLDYLRLGIETGEGNHTGRTTFHLDRDASVTSTVLSLGRMKHRHDATAVFRGEGSSASLNGLFVGAGGERAEHHTLVVHAARHATSRQLYKAVLAEKARTVFDGQVVVAPGAAGTDAAQSNRNLLLSDGARAHTQPRLEIHADDVKCAHGAAIGRLDETALFYLRSRGLGALDSRDLLIEAFAAEVVEQAGDDTAQHLAAAALARVRSAGGRA